MLHPTWRRKSRVWPIWKASSLPRAKRLTMKCLHLVTYPPNSPWGSHDIVDRGTVTSISRYGRGCDHFRSKDEGSVTWQVGSEWGLEGSKEQTARRPARHWHWHHAHSSASGQPAKKIHPLKFVVGAGLEYLLTCYDHTPWEVNKSFLMPETITFC